MRILPSWSMVMKLQVGSTSGRTTSIVRPYFSFISGQ